jgi:hypothetical protein
MKRSNRFKIPALILPILMIMISTSAIVLAQQAPVNLGTTSTYAVMAGTTITNTGTTVINGDAGGDVGLYPGSDFTGQSTITMSGALHINDTEVIQATTDLIAAYDDAAGRTPATLIPEELGGTTLTPGVYYSTEGSFLITGTLTLDAQNDPEGVFVFLTTTTLITEDNSSIDLINAARYCRTFWKVGSSATLGVNSHFVGHLFALTSITANTGASIQGQLLARNGAVTLQANTIMNGLCADEAGINPQTSDAGSLIFLGLSILIGISASAVYMFRSSKQR